MSNQPRPAPRASSTDDTPPSGIDLDVVRSLPLESAVLYLGEELRKMREDQARELASIVRHQRATNESVGGLIEAVSEQTRTIGDLRIIVERAAVHADRARALQRGDQGHAEHRHAPPADYRDDRSDHFGGPEPDGDHRRRALKSMLPMRPATTVLQPKKDSDKALRRLG